MKKYWLIKSEPYKWSWEDQTKVTSEPWDGVRNYQARNFMKDMKKDDEAFFYHSNQGKEIIGIVRIVKEHYPDPTDLSDKFVCVDVSAKKELPIRVSLEHIKKHPDLQSMALLKQSRLSVSPVSKEEWHIITSMGGL